MPRKFSLRIESARPSKMGRHPSAMPMIFEAFCPTSCGFITADRRRAGGHHVWRIGSVHVEEGFRRRGVATGLYEAAAKAACTRGEMLVSAKANRDPLAHSNAFWQKQQQKGRVKTTPKGDYILLCPVTSLADARRRR